MSRDEEIKKVEQSNLIPDKAKQKYKKLSSKHVEELERRTKNNISEINTLLKDVPGDSLDLVFGLE